MPNNLIQCVGGPLDGTKVEMNGLYMSGCGEGLNVCNDELGDHTDKYHFQIHGFGSNLYVWNEDQNLVNGYFKKLTAIDF